MKKKELILKMQTELPNYQFGLHNISLRRYLKTVKSGNKRDKKIELTDSFVSEKSIAERILGTGLHVVEKSLGFRSTVIPIINDNDECLDYSGWRTSKGICTNVIIAIPYTINYDGNEYFLGDLLASTNMANDYIFNECVDKEFIFGYYNIEFEEYPRSFSDDIEFIKNPNFFENLDKESQNQVLKRLLTAKRNILGDLKLVIDYNKFKMFFKSYYERTIIDLTRKQGIKLFEKKIITTKIT